MGNSNSSNLDDKKIHDNKADELIKKITLNTDADLDVNTTLDDLTEFDNNKTNELDEKNQKGGKRKIPMLNVNSDFTKTGGNFLNGFQNKTGRKRYTKYDLFKILKNLEVETDVQEGGDNLNSDNTRENEKSEDDMKRLKNIILAELDELKKKSNENGLNGLNGGGCGCSGSKDNKTHNRTKDLNSNQDGGDKRYDNVVIDDSSSTSSSSDDSESSSSEMGKKNNRKNNKKGKKSKKIDLSNKTESTDQSNFFINTEKSDTDADNTNELNGGTQTSNEDSFKNNKESDESDEGLSIFPFNSSDVKSSRSIQNYRMLRRKI